MISKDRPEKLSGISGDIFFYISKHIIEFRDMAINIINPFQTGMDKLESIQAII